MVMLAEQTAVKALEPYLPAGQNSVGSRVHLRHLAPTLKGMQVRAVATVSEIDRRRVTFSVEVFDDVEQVGQAEHDRFIIDDAKYLERLADKESGAAGAAAV